jgi:hypothetical protein
LNVSNSCGRSDSNQDLVTILNKWNHGHGIESVIFVCECLLEYRELHGVCPGRSAAVRFPENDFGESGRFPENDFVHVKKNAVDRVKAETRRPALMHVTASWNTWTQIPR